MSPGVPAPWWETLKTSGSVTVFHVDLAEDSTRESAALALLDETEHRRRRGFAFAGPRRQFTLCRAALRTLLTSHLGCCNDQLSFGTTTHGKPFARVEDEPAPVSFNVSHGGRHGLIALAARGRVGVDVEERTEHRSFDLLVDATFGAEERAELAAREGSQQLHLFFRLWTMKEALLKAHGAGLILDPTAFEIPPALRKGRAGGAVELPELPGVTWRVEDLGNDKYAAAVAYELSP
ncbi:MAG: 4'-phosphopantetheinyl transferase superfamily protein [Chloroflexi bacterium]|nr:4'-phosphopantetheinyl transferase superfamily protein [Chloroflexota bacterium]